MNKPAESKSRSDKCMSLTVFLLATVLILSVGVYFLPEHPLLISIGFVVAILALLRPKEANKTLDLISSFGLCAMAAICTVSLKILQWPLKVLGLLPKDK